MSITRDDLRDRKRVDYTPRSSVLEVKNPSGNYLRFSKPHKKYKDEIVDGVTIRICLHAVEDGVLWVYPVVGENNEPQTDALFILERHRQDQEIFILRGHDNLLVCGRDPVSMYRNRGPDIWRLWLASRQ